MNCEATFDASLVAGSPWRMAVYLADDNGDPVPLATPAAMDVRKGSSRFDPLIVRLDSDPDPDVGEGLIAPDGLPRAGLVLTLADTDTLPEGNWFYDLWCEFADEPGAMRLLLSGRFRITGRITDELVP